MSNKEKESNPLVVLGLALGLPSSILAVSLGVLYLSKQGHISQTLAIIIIIAVVANTFYLMLRYAKKNEDKS